MTGKADAALTVEAALARVLHAVTPIADAETVSLFDAHGRTLDAPLKARLTQPPFTASAMDGYAVRATDVSPLPATLHVIGEAAAGHAFAGALTPGEAVRIFTGAPLPAGADAIVIQENTRRSGDRVTILEGQPDLEHVRPAGGDFTAGTELIGADRRLTPRHLTLAAAGGHATLQVRRKPVVAILATGDELVSPGEQPGADQIVCSNPYGIAAMVAAAGGAPVFLGIARDLRADLEAHVAKARDADVLVTLGGASVGDHDLVAQVIGALGMDLSFWKIAMRPGKPLMFGTIARQRVLGLPGNPVSSLITARLFLIPLVRALLGLEPEPTRTSNAYAGAPLAANGPRAHYMRASLSTDLTGRTLATPVASQDSSLLTPLTAADALIVRPIGAPSLPAGALVPILPLDF
jgi:molybdopterin molybdotransferase